MPLVLRVGQPVTVVSPALARAMGLASGDDELMHLPSISNVDKLTGTVAVPGKTHPLISLLCARCTWFVHINQVIPPSLDLLVRSYLDGALTAYDVGVILRS